MENAPLDTARNGSPAGNEGGRGVYWMYMHAIDKDGAWMWIGMVRWYGHVRGSCEGGHLATSLHFIMFIGLARGVCNEVFRGYIVISGLA